MVQEEKVDLEEARQKETDRQDKILMMMVNRLTPLMEKDDVMRMIPVKYGTSDKSRQVGLLYVNILLLQETRKLIGLLSREGKEKSKRREK